MDPETYIPSYPAVPTEGPLVRVVQDALRLVGEGAPTSAIGTRSSSTTNRVKSFASRFTLSSFSIAGKSNTSRADDADADDVAGAGREDALPSPAQPEAMAAHMAAIASTRTCLDVQDGASAGESTSADGVASTPDRDAKGAKGEMRRQSVNSKVSASAAELLSELEAVPSVMEAEAEEALASAHARDIHLADSFRYWYVPLLHLALAVPASSIRMAQLTKTHCSCTDGYSS